MYVYHTYHTVRYEYRYFVHHGDKVHAARCVYRNISTTTLDIYFERVSVTDIRLFASP